jgi:hypothetical protein
MGRVPVAPRTSKTSLLGERNPKGFHETVICRGFIKIEMRNMAEFNQMRIDTTWSGF